MTTAQEVIAVIESELGTDYYDTEIVTDVMVGYAEPGYGSLAGDDVIVLGNWNPKRFPHGDDAPLTEAENVGPRLADKLGELGAEIEWLDEWYKCGECYRAVRAVEDSYSWQPSYVMGDGEVTCFECALKHIEDYLTDYLNNSDKCVTWAKPSDLEAIGFVKYAPGDEHDYANGWYPGQNDKPSEIFDEIEREMPGHDVVFFLDGTGQFDIHFSAYVRPTN